MPNKQKNKKEFVKLLFKYDPSYSISYPSDVFGGMNPKGKLILNFFTDLHSPPISEKHKLNKDFKIDPTAPAINTYLDDEEEKDEFLVYYDRIIHHTTVISSDDAINIGLWMISTVINDPNFQYDKERLKKHFLKMIDMPEEKNDKENKPTE